jgi:hypothetical protein
MEKEGELHVFLTSTLDGGEWLASCLCLAPGIGPPVPTEGRKALIALLDDLEKREVPYPAGNKRTYRQNAAHTPIPILNGLPQLT